MPNSVDLLKSAINSYLKPNRFKVLIDGQFMVSAHSVNIPNITINYTEALQYYVGKDTKLPTDINFSELTITFYVTVQETGIAREIEYFLSWVDNKDGSKSVFRKLSSSTYVLNYQEEYSRDILIQQLNEAGETINVFRFYKCFVTSINYSDLSYASENQLMEVTVNFGFEDFESDSIYE